MNKQIYNEKTGFIRDLFEVDPKKSNNKRRKPKDKVKNRRLYSIQELVSEIGGTINFWRERIWKGKLPFIQDGRKHFVDIEDVEKFINGHKKKHGCSKGDENYGINL